MCVWEGALLDQIPVRHLPLLRTTVSPVARSACLLLSPGCLHFVAYLVPIASGPCPAPREPELEMLSV